ncbi:unnamed protein product [Diatraea saccharalis]|uniref:Transposable element P transposase-like RNase H domain-containing protein n=1 Tax=Diatraea saccharalis TaxID=40085 RepID=A0A9N9RGD7_9NEOP|nr:unnamed protein product [Diatraea saccharalis]
MTMSESLCLDTQSHKYSGRVNTDIDLESDPVEVAGQSLDFLINCINGKWKFPLAYFLITRLRRKQKAAHLLICLQKCKVGVKIISITYDGPAANFSMFEHLRCDLMQADGRRTYFKFDYDKIYCFIDPCHAVKLIRNLW